MVCWRRNTKALHFVKQSGALQAKSCSCSSRTSELPISALASSQNFSTHLVFEGGVCNFWFRLLVAFERCWFKDAIIGENDATRNVVLELSDVAGPVVAQQGAHGFLRDGFDGFVHGRGKLLERNIPQVREYRLSFRVAVADKSGKHSAGNTNLREIRGPEPFA